MAFSKLAWTVMQTNLMIASHGTGVLDYVVPEQEEPKMEKKEFGIGHFAPGAVVEVTVSNRKPEIHIVEGLIKNGPRSYLIQTTSPSPYESGPDKFSVNIGWVTRIIKAGTGGLKFIDPRGWHSVQKCAEDMRKFGMPKPKSKYSAISGSELIYLLVCKYVKPDMVLDHAKMIRLLVDQGVMQVVREPMFLKVYASKKKINKAFKANLNRCLVPLKKAQAEEDKMIAESYERDWEDDYNDRHFRTDCPTTEEGSYYDADLDVDAFAED